MGFSTEVGDKGIVYCVAYRYRYPYEDIPNRWNINLYSSDRGRKIGLRSLNDPVYEVLKFEMKLQDMTRQAKYVPFISKETNKGKDTKDIWPPIGKET